MITLKDIDRSKLQNRHTKESLDESLKQYNLRRDRILAECSAKGLNAPRVVA